MLSTGARASAVQASVHYGSGLSGGTTAQLLAYGVLLLVMASTAFAQPNMDFCDKLVKNLFTCPDVPTVDTVQLEQYTGRWYEVGVSAAFAFAVFGQQGGQCVTANYTALGVVNGANTIKVVNRALLTTTPIRQAQGLGISLSAQSTGLGIRLVCQFLVGTQPLSALLAHIPAATRAWTGHVEQQATQQKRTGKAEMARRPRKAAPARWYTTAAEDLLNEGVETATSARNKGPLNEIVESVEGILMSFPSIDFTAPFSVSGFNNVIINSTLESNTLDADTKDKILEQAHYILDGIIAMSLNSKTASDSLATVQAGNLILNGASLPDVSVTLDRTILDINSSAANIQSLVGVTQNANREFILSAARAVLDLAGAKEPKVSQAAQAIIFLTDALGPIDLAINETDASAELIIRTAATVRPEAVQNRTIEAVGQAVQNASQPGALTVSFSQLAPPPSSNNYKIIKLEGEAANGYDLALVYSCSSGLLTAGLAQQGLFILSRTPSVPPEVLADALAFTAEQGIFLVGDNTVLTINQNGGLCQPIRTLP